MEAKRKTVPGFLFWPGNRQLRDRDRQLSSFRRRVYSRISWDLWFLVAKRINQKSISFIRSLFETWWKGIVRSHCYCFRIFMSCQLKKRRVSVLSLVLFVGCCCWQQEWSRVREPRSAFLVSVCVVAVSLLKSVCPCCNRQEHLLFANKSREERGVNLNLFSQQRKKERINVSVSLVK